jgi:pyruvate,water dikinase
VRERIEAVRSDLLKRLERSGYTSGREFYVENLSQKIALLALAFDGRDVVYRTTDYKSNEYAGLLGGGLFETPESNPMIGWRGVSRGIDRWEVEAFLKARQQYGAKNLHIMFPFVRTEEEIVETVASTRSQGLKSGDRGLKVFVMAEIPSVAALPSTFLRHVDGFSIGSNDLTQGMLMTDRDSAKLQKTYDEEDPTVVQGMLSIIFTAIGQNKEVGFCGMGVSNSPMIAAMVSVAGISSASVTPDAFAKVSQIVHGIEAENISVAGLGAWMNAHKRMAMKKALEATGLDLPKDLEPAAAYAWIQEALVRAYARAASLDPQVQQAGRGELVALKKASKAVVHANTDWEQVVDNALHTAGFASAGEYDRLRARRRAEGPAHA